MTRLANTYGGMSGRNRFGYFRKKSYICSMEKKINYGELYGVLPGENDFSGAIARSLEDGKKNLSGEFLKMISEIYEKRRLQKL